MATISKTFDVFAGDVSANILTEISRWRWLQATDIAAFLYPGRASARRYIEDRLEQLEAGGFVLGRQLPGARAARAWVLTVKGAARLNEFGVQPRPWPPSADDSRSEPINREGTRWGKTEDGKWTPSIHWRHDLLARYIAATWLARNPGGTVITDSDLRMYYAPALFSRSNLTQKYPDLILMTPTTYEFVEIEQAPKTGADMAELTKFIIDANTPALSFFLPFTGKGRTRTGITAVVPMRRKDARGCHVDHKLRLTSALEKASPHRQIRLGLIEVEFSAGGFTPKSAQLTEFITHPQKAEPGKPTPFAPFKPADKAPEVQKVQAPEAQKPENEETQMTAEDLADYEQMERDAAKLNAAYAFEE